MKVVLINPPQPELQQPKAYTPLGLAYIGAVLEQSGIEVKIANLADAKTVREKDIPEADWYGVTCVTATYPKVVQITRMLRKMDRRVIVGGVHPTILPWSTFYATLANHIITGEAEYALRDLVESNPQLPSVIHAGIIQNLDLLPLPARHLFPPDEVVDTTGIHGCERGVKATSLISSRGCPYSCNYCCKGHDMFKVFRYRSAESVRDELEHLIDEYGVAHVRFVDDAFTANRDRVFHLCARIEDLNITWVAITRADLLDMEMLTAMREAGCIELHIGVESGSDRLLKLMNKGEDTATYLQAIAKIKETGMRVKVYLMVNYPTETEEDVEQTKQFMRKAKPDLWTLSNLQPLVGSRLPPIEESDGWFYPDGKGDERYLTLRKWLEEGEWRA